MKKLLFALFAAIPLMARAELPFEEWAANVILWNEARGQDIENVVPVFGTPDSWDHGICGAKTKEPWECLVIAWDTKTKDGDKFTHSIAFARQGERWLAASCLVKNHKRDASASCDYVGKELLRQLEEQQPKAKPKQQTPALPRFDKGARSNDT